MDGLEVDMERAFDQQFYLNRQADQIERALFRLNMPARVDGGYIEKDHIRYLVTPSLGIPLESFLDQAPEVAQEIGVEDVRFARERRGVAIEVPYEQGMGVRLLPLMESLTELEPFMAVLGLTVAGSPLLLDFNMSTTWHLFAQGGGASEFLRSILLSLALTSSPRDAGFLGVDIGGRELAVIEALPHAVKDLATNADYARANLQWLYEEIEARLQNAIDFPHLFLFIDGIDELLQLDDDHLLHYVLQHGKSSGVHVIGASRTMSGSAVRNFAQSEGIVLAGPLPADSGLHGGSAGRFSLQADGNEDEIDFAWLSARDLDTAVHLIRA
jgi:DNA segregation ATPase FtsK/SpoIIIE-like protein